MIEKASVRLHYHLLKIKHKDARNVPYGDKCMSYTHIHDIYTKNINNRPQGSINAPI